MLQVYSRPEKNTASRVIAVASGKGGVGKTMSTVGLGRELAKLGHKVLIIDLDTGLRNADLIMGVENRVVFTLWDVVKGRCALHKALVYDKKYKRLLLLATAQHCTADEFDVDEIAEVCRQARYGFDYILLDCPAGIESGFQQGLYSADEVVVVTTPEMSAIRDADKVVGFAQSLSKPVSVLVNMVRADMVSAGDMLSLENVQSLLCVPLLGYLPYSAELCEGKDLLYGEGRMKYPEAVKKGYTEAALRLAGADMPLKDIPEAPFTEKLKYKLRRKLPILSIVR
ncbi:septum site-determining protein MinD [Thermovirga lienii]|uniref:septum site-determining protein MinD n=1 Tax=Thermovirga lienii TaxID=336261 RepID=UPI002FE3514B